MEYGEIARRSLNAPDRKTTHFYRRFRRNTSSALLQILRSNTLGIEAIWRHVCGGHQELPGRNNQ
eukprot:1323438-Amorphochlora_amoeboformis.AAC.3